MASKAKPVADISSNGGARGARHVAIIMDGNGRWAKKRFLPRAAGHKAGVEAVRKTVRAAREMGLECLTLYAFSSENWKRPEQEIADLTGLMKFFIRADLREFHENNVRLRIIGDYSAFDAEAVALIDEALATTANNTGCTLVIALNYGSQDELVRAASKAAQKGAITAETIGMELDTADLPPLDLLIRTSGEQRLSNFLLWQAAYAELYFTDMLWPDFDGRALAAALESFAARERRFGGL
ncbi:MAG: isoprenyl transferase [Sphingobium sp.]